LSLPSSTAPLSPIENEIPAYRAISSLAVFSLVLGIASVFAFASLSFALLGLGAVVCGTIALSRIRRFPDMLTGSGLANVGIALGLVFSLSATTFATTRWLQVRQSASAFAEGYAKLLDSNDMATAAWYRIPPAQRDKDRQKQYQQMVKETDIETKQRMLGDIMAVQTRATKPDAKVEFVRLEAAGYDGVTPYAIALFHVIGGEEPHAEGEKGHVHDDSEDYLMAEMRSDPSQKGFAWYMKEIAYPYKPASYTPAPKPVSDGHNH
jgi:hypothetical protein